MNEIEYFNLIWLAGAFTEARKPGRRFYYDTQTAIFFYVVDAGIEGTRILYSTIDLKITGDQYHDLVLRLAMDDEDRSGIVELPRFKEQEKKDIQIRFLMPYDGHQYHYEYYKAIENQTDDEGFILDQVMVIEDFDPLPSLWEQYKLQFVYHCATQFAGAIGIVLNLAG